MRKISLVTIGTWTTLFVGLLVLGVGQVFSAATPHYVVDPATCPAQDDQFPGQKCPSGLYICGVDSGDIPQCYDTTQITAPENTATSNTQYTASLDGGYIIDCFAQPLDTTAPYCDNNGAWLCNRDDSCYDSPVNKVTTCTGPGTYTCSDCRSGYQDCDAETTTCEVQTNVTDYPTGDNNNYGASCTARCDTNYLDCDEGGIGIGNGCEILDGGTCDAHATYDGCSLGDGNCVCSSGYYDCNGDLGLSGDGCEVQTNTACTTDQGITGTYNECTCVPDQSYFETGTESTYSTADPLLWGTQVGTGALIKMSNASGEQFTVTNSGAIKAGSGLVLNADNTAADTTISFGNALGAQVIKFNNATQQFEFSDDVHVTGTVETTGGLTVGGAITLNGVSYTFPDSAGSPGHVLTTDGNGTLTWQIDDTAGSGLGQTEADERYVNIGGDTMTGALVIDNEGAEPSLVVKGTASGTAIHAEDSLTASGTLSVEGVASFQSTLEVNGVTYTFPDSDGTASGKVLKTDGAGQLSWSDDSAVTSYTLERVFQPLFPGAVYQGDGENNVGQLALSHTGGLLTNYYAWTSTRTSLQDYDILLRVTLSSEFVSWDTTPLEVSYHTTSSDAGVSKLDVSVYDTAGNVVTLVGGSTDLASTTWATKELTFDGTPTWTAGEDFLIVFHLSAHSDAAVHLGKVKIRYADLNS